MKKIILVVQLCIVSLALVTITGCASSPVSTALKSPEIPWQEHAMLFTFNSRNLFGSRSFISNDEVVIYGFNDVNSSTPLQQYDKIGLIPPGTQTIHFLIIGKDSFGNRTEIKKSLTYEFQPGGRYVLFGRMTDTTYMREKADAQIFTLDEFKPVFIANRDRGYTAEEWDSFGGYTFEEFVIARFDKAATEFSK